MPYRVIKDDVEPGDYYEEYFEWIVKTHDGGYKDLYIGLYEDGWRFDDFLEERHPDRMMWECAKCKATWEAPVAHCPTSACGTEVSA